MGSCGNSLPTESTPIVRDTLPIVSTPLPDEVPYLCSDLIALLFQYAPCDSRRAMRLVCPEWNRVCMEYWTIPLECCGTPGKFQTEKFWRSIPVVQIPGFTTFICQRQYMKELEKGLMWMSSYGHAKAVKHLIDAGTNVHIWMGYPLRLASKHGHVEVVRLLLAAGANIRVCMDTPLRYASQYGYVEIVDRLLTVGADVHADGDYSLRYASQYDHVEVVDRLLAAGARY